MPHPEEVAREAAGREALARGYASRLRVRDALREVLQVDPTFCPHADLVLERLSLLGEGGMGVVTRVRDRRLGREAALKVILGDADAETVARFRREAEITARLDHPSIPPVYEAGTNAAGVHFMLMRLIEGATLGERIKAFHADGQGLGRANADLRDLLEALVKVGEAVAYAHSQGVIHRDLKPDNVMLGKFGEVLVLDWGLAREEGEQREETERILSLSQPRVSLEEAQAVGLTVAGAIMGTPGYMPTEQASGAEVDARADVFALGAMLVCVLTGRPATEGVNLVNKLFAAVEGPVHLPRDRRRDAPPELNSIAAKALAFRREDRYPSADAFTADLKAYLAGHDVAEHRYGLWERLQRALRRHPRRVVAVVLALLLVAIGALGLGLGRAQRERALAEISEQEALNQKAEVDEEKVRAEASERKARASEQKARASERKARASERASRAFSDEGKVRIALKQGAALPARPEAIERWLKLADDLLSRAPEHEARLEELRRAPRGEAAGQDLERRVERAALASLLAGLKELAPLPARERLRLDFADRLAERTTTRAEAAAAWERAKEAIAAEPRYAGLTLEPTVGLVPLGPDPASGLWEFWHVESGARPERDARGRHVVDEESGLVLVLIPAGSFRMGSDRGRKRERPAHEVRLGAFFLSKYEVTQGQWQRARGVNPSTYQAQNGPYSLGHPVEQVSWRECEGTALRWGLRLPSEAEWEFACRAGGETRWWTGASAASLRGAVNLADASLEKSAPGRFKTVTWSDGFATHAPVGSFRANAFGLHEMAGNVCEWCQDAWRGDYEGASARGAARELTVASVRVYRGGSWANDPASCRSTAREGEEEASRDHRLGFRPARSLGR